MKPSMSLGKVFGADVPPFAKRFQTLEEANNYSGRRKKTFQPQIGQLNSQIAIPDNHVKMTRVPPIFRPKSPYREDR